MHCWTQRFIFGILAAVSSLSLQGEASQFASVKNFGMGNVGVAYPQDAMAGAYNPASIVYVSDRADIGGFWLSSDPMVEVENSTLPNANAEFGALRGRQFGTPSFGIVYHPCGACDVAWSVVAYTRDFMKASYDSPFPALGTSDLMMEYWSGVVSPMFAMRLERFSFGISANFIGQTFEARGFENMDVAGRTLYLGDVTGRGSDWTQAFSLTLGGMWRVNDCWTLGMSWETQGRAFHFNNYKGLIPRKGRIDLPARITGGFRFHPNECMNIAVDFQHVNWGSIDFWHNGLPDDLATLTTRPFGSHSGPGLGWRNQIIGRVGADYTFCKCYTVRAGYQYGQTPTRSEETLMNSALANVVEHWVMAGLTVKACCGEISGYFAYGAHNEVKGRDGSVGADFGGGTYDISNKQFSAGISYGWCY